MLRAEKRYLPFSFIVVGALCMHRYHVLVRFNDNNFDNKIVSHENEKADISETVDFISIILSLTNNVPDPWHPPRATL